MLRACVLSQGRQRAESLARQRCRSLPFIGSRAESGAGVAARATRTRSMPPPNDQDRGDDSSGSKERSAALARCRIRCGLSPARTSRHETSRYLAGAVGSVLAVSAWASRYGCSSLLRMIRFVMPPGRSGGGDR